MKKTGTIILAASMTMAVHAQLIDDFSGDLSAYTATRILNNGNHSPGNTYSWQIAGGSLQINTPTYVGIEQYALTRNDNPLAIGYELTTTYSGLNLNSQDIGLYVGAGTPTTDVRANYLDIYVRNNGQIFSRGFDGTTEVALGGGSIPSISSLFIARTGANVFELGYYDGATRNIISTRTMTSSTIGDSIGFYADVRGAGTRGNLDNLTLQVVPEPSTAAFAAMGFLALAARLRRR